MNARDAFFCHDRKVRTAHAVPTELLQDAPRA